jgi:DNA 3'-phosphatase
LARFVHHAHAMKLPRILAPAFSLAAFSFAAIVGVACTSEPQSEELAHSSCEGAKLDAAGVCRKNGRYAKKVCCAAKPNFPTTRQSLEAYSCGDQDEPVKVAFFDADSTLRISRGGTPTANAKDDVYVLPFVASKIKELNDEGYLIAIVSNQGGVAAGYTPIEVAEAAILFVGEQLHKLGAKIDYADFAEEKNDFRKPKTGMAELLDEVLQDKCGVGIDYEASFMVGDAGYKKDVDGPHPDGRPADDFSHSDRGFAENLGIPFSEPTDYFGWRDYGYFNIRYKSQLEGVLAGVDEEIEALEESGEDDERLEVLRAEVRDNRSVNELAD